MYLNMHKNAKIYLVLCLICLQIVVPFIHAHAFGQDSFKEHTLHLHTNEVGNIDSLNNRLSQTDMSENEIVGAVTTVASGIKTSLADDIADGIAVVAIFFTLILLIFSATARFVSNPIQALHTKQYLHSVQNPRAPPY